MKKTNVRLIILTVVYMFVFFTSCVSAIAASNNQPTWFEHVDLMQLIIAGLILLVGWFVKRDLNRFENKLNGVCNTMKLKVDKTDNDAEHIDIWKRVNHHKHADTGEVVIVEKT